MTSDYENVSIKDLSRWIEETCPEGMIVVQDERALAGNQIEWTDAVRRAKAWCEANPFPLGTGQANASLINTSPELLKEVIRLRGVIVEMVTASLCGQQLAPGDVDIDMNKTDSIIAKARGENV